MLQVINLTKIYKSKNGAAVHALDGVTLQFPDTGMVFLLGKSGSGKSTLLNVCGGLDSPTGGEIIVKGKSSKNFSQSDFDSYRNTYVGFVFQEYNILNEFTVEDNIALALELQGKPKNKKAVNALLEEVDLKGFAKRKPNTLSGGQKQRIAIARALIKSPEIIMADEPTGALDSTTGKQVLDTLKKLSKDKLVIVVSHDKDFAEQYADRIIELKDGKVLSDVSKTQIEQKSLSNNVNTLGDVLCIKKGSELTETDFEKIKAFLKKSSDDIVIASSEKDVKNFKKISRINDAGEKEVFLDTIEDNVETKQYSEKDSRFIRSKLPLKHAVKIGFSGLRSKPVRLLFTVLLCTVAFVLFGLLSTLSFYDSEATFRKTLQDSDNSIMKIEKQYKSDVVWYYQGEESHSYQTVYSTRYTEGELSEYKQSFGEDVFGGVVTNTMLNVRSQAAPYWLAKISTFAYLPENNSLRARINGKYPQNKNEIILSSYVADAICQCKIYDFNGDALELSKGEEIIGERIVINGNTYKVVGIFDSGAISDKFESLKASDESTGRLESEMYTMLEDGLHLFAFVTEDRLSQISEEYIVNYNDESIYREISAAMGQMDGEVSLPEWANAVYIPYSQYTGAEAYIEIAAGKTSPADNEAIIPSNMFYNLVVESLSKIDWNTLDMTTQEQVNNIQILAFDLMNGGVWEVNVTNGESELKEFTDEQMLQKTKQLVSLIEDYDIPFELHFEFFNSYDQIAFGDMKTFNIIGIYMTNNNNGYSKVVLSDNAEKELWDEQKLSVNDYLETSTAYKEKLGAVYDNIFLSYDHSEEQTDIYWQMYKNEEFAEDDSKTSLTGDFVSNLRLVDELVDSLSKTFLYVGIVMAVFAALLFSNFISVSISQKKRDIGILRAVGARSVDVFKIFFSESFFISVICVVLATIGCVVLSNYINIMLSEGIGASLVVFGPAAFGVLLLVAGVTAIVATFLPVYNAAKKKPVDSIRAV